MLGGRIIFVMEKTPEDDIFSENQRQEVLAKIYVNENLAYESLLTLINEAEWQFIYAWRKSKPSEEILKYKGRVHRLQESQRRFIKGERPSKFFK